MTVVIVAALVGVVAMWLQHLPWIEVYLPDGRPVKGAHVYGQIVSARAIHLGETDEKGRVGMPAAHGWQSISVTYWDASGKRYGGQVDPGNLNSRQKIYLTPW